MSNPYGTGPSYVPYSQQQSFSSFSPQSKGQPLAGNPMQNLYQGTVQNPYQLNWAPENIKPVDLSSARFTPYERQNPFASGQSFGRLGGARLTGAPDLELMQGFDRGTIVNQGGQAMSVDYTRNPFEAIYSALERASGTNRQTVAPGKGNALPMQGGPQLNDQYFADERARAEKYAAPQYRNASNILGQVQNLSLDQLKNLTYDTSVRDLFQNSIGNMQSLYANPVAAQQMGSSLKEQQGYLERAYGHLMDQMKNYYLY